MHCYIVIRLLPLAFVSYLVYFRWISFNVVTGLLHCPPIKTIESTGRHSFWQQGCGNKQRLKRFFLVNNDCDILSKHVVFQRKAISHVETFEEQQMRELWEGNDDEPFTIARSFVDGIIQESVFVRQQQKYFFKKILFTGEKGDALSGFEHMFDPLYDSCNYLFRLPNQMVITDHGNTNQIKPSDVRRFCLRVAYRGEFFCGWQTQPDNNQKPSIQKTLEDSLTLLMNNHNDTDTPEIYKANLRVAGRTDAGVHAIGQICRFSTRRKDLTPNDIQQHVLNTVKTMNESSGCLSIRVTDVVEVSRAFHPTFTTTCRAYVYLVDIPVVLEHFWSYDGNIVPKIIILNTLLQDLEGKYLDYVGLSYGKLKTQTSICKLYHARAHLVELIHIKNGTKLSETSNNNDKVSYAICIELVGDRFLRRMVRLLVEAAMRLAITEYEKQKMRKKKSADATTIANSVIDRSSFHKDSHLSEANGALLNHVLEKDRKLLHRMAPPDGLIFVGALFE